MVTDFVANAKQKLIFNETTLFQKNIIKFILIHHFRNHEQLINLTDSETFIRC